MSEPTNEEVAEGLDALATADETWIPHAANPQYAFDLQKRADQLRLAASRLRSPGEGLREALEGYMAAVRALGEIPPGRRDTYFEAPLLETDDGVARWEALDRAGKQALAALASSGLGSGGGQKEGLGSCSAERAATPKSAVPQAGEPSAVRDALLAGTMSQSSGGGYRALTVEWSGPDKHRCADLVWDALETLAGAQGTELTPTPADARPDPNPPSTEGGTNV